MDRKSVPSNKKQGADNWSSSSSGASNSRILLLLVASKTNGERMHRPFVGPKLTAHLPRSYFKVIELGYMTEDPAAYHDPDVCVPYINNTQTA